MDGAVRRAARHLALPESERDYAAQALRLAEQLGAETVTLAAHDAVEEILDYARSRNCSKIVLGKPGRYWRLRDLLVGSFVARLAHRSGDIDVFIVHGERPEPGMQPAAPAPAEPTPWAAYGWAVALVALCTAVAAVLFRWFAPSNLVMIYLLGVVVAATRWGADRRSSRRSSASRRSTCSSSRPTCLSPWPTRSTS